MMRQDYMDGKVTHADYYRSIARAAGISFELGPFELLRQVKEALVNGDDHLNTIPLSVWDRLATAAYMNGSVIRAFKEHGDFWSLAGGVCLAKQAAKDAAKKA